MWFSVNLMGCSIVPLGAEGVPVPVTSSAFTKSGATGSPAASDVRAFALRRQRIAVRIGHIAKRERAPLYRKYSIAVLCSKGASTMARYTTSDLSRKSGDIIAEALRKPVTITQRNKPRLVLLSIEDYRRLAARGDTRKARMLAQMSDEDFAEFRRAVEIYAAENDEG